MPLFVSFVGGEMVRRNGVRGRRDGADAVLFSFVRGEMVLTENNKYVDAVVSFVGGEMAFKVFL